ncbi:MAG TPA: fluoride efflux transporter CrcB [Acidimicrobiales bacterium]|nr:fluoride efflux transporter CrcB [Acidimicrobiales bacterium]
MTVVAVALAASLGAIARYLIDLVVQHRTATVRPLGTLTVNLTGSLALGLLVGFELYHGLGDAVRSVIGTGLIGAYTTFSTFSYETMRLLADGDNRGALVNIATNLFGGLTAATVGLCLAAAW